MALVESSSYTLASMYSYNSETDESQVAKPELLELGFVSNYMQFGVDRDFVVCLENVAPVVASEAEVGGAQPTSIVPNYIPGHPW